MNSYDLVDSEGKKIEYGDLLRGHYDNVVFIRAFDYKLFYVFLPSEMRGLNEIVSKIERIRKEGMKNRDLYYENLNTFDHSNKQLTTKRLKIDKSCLSEQNREIYEELTKILNSLFIT